MAEIKEKGVPFALALNTRPRQYGLTDFTVTRYVLGTAAALTSPEDITASVDIDEFVVPAPAYLGTPTVSVQGFAKSARIGVVDPAKEIETGDVISIAGAVYAVLDVTTDVNGAGHIDLALPLRENVAAATPIARSGCTGNYRITITENSERSVQYKVVSESAYPRIELDSQVLDIVTTNDVLVDNSKLLL